MDKAELRAALPGPSLAAVAEKQGKSVAALEAAMLDRAERLRERLSKYVDRLVAKTFPANDS